MKMFAHRLAGLLTGTAILFAGPALAQQQKPTPVPTAQVPAEQVEMGGPALWKVADEDTTIYLFGTVHALPKDVDWFKGNVADALASSDILVTEIMMTPDAATDMQSIIMNTGMLPADQKLRDMLDEKQRASYDAAMTKLGMPVETFDRFEPWYASMMLSMLPIMKEGYSPESGVEAVLTTKGGEAKPRGELETIEFQMSLFDQLPLDSQIAFLVQAAEGVDTIKGMLDKMIAEWLEGDADGLAELMNEGLTDQVLAERLLYQRNANWAEWIDTRLDTPGTVFIAVGAGHLAGAKSVQDALELRGIETARVQ
ncbi:TraB/GumN family protein [Allopontixanthobacter sediminis]|uniref:TraB/GumN family protein n=1 Tax=Allopontixanthobacter sediminis TaxID=1689985 RepID=A0A845B213_9SPHN|nr:TraB/GumN family protein [Allopontixanthobacter sediminis]MXP43672.1 TraB/GumN family protein [Allopontixanthobacter sediminis]